jgi:hypothetical protein
MIKTTVYLPDDLKAAVRRAAAERRMSEAAVIRQAIESDVAALRRPKPEGGFITGDWEQVDWNTNDWLKGFGES